MNKKLTNRGFSRIEFEDSYGTKCNMQKSSSIIPHVWLGIEKAEPIIQMRNVSRDQNEDDIYGWVNYPLPDEVFINTRMHIDVELAKELINMLQKFVDNEDM